jgi:hypothetical protein
MQYWGLVPGANRLSACPEHAWYVQKTVAALSLPQPVWGEYALHALRAHKPHAWIPTVIVVWPYLPELQQCFDTAAG